MELEQLIRISKFAGERFDLVQGPGGNTSVKLDDGSMLIKASGYLLSDVEKDHGYARVDTQKIKNIITNATLIKAKTKRERESIASQLVKDATLSTGARPSIETLLHSFLFKFALHTHPLAVNMIVNRPDWKEILKSLFPELPLAMVAYQTPGVELAIELCAEIGKFPQTPKIIFLQNHGLIVSSDLPEEVDNLTDQVVKRLETYLKVSFDAYKMPNRISRLMHAAGVDSVITYFSEDSQINNLLSTQREIFFTHPFFPDKQVFCGVKALQIDSLDDPTAIQNYKQTYHDWPKIIIHSDQLFIVARNIKKAKEIEEVLKFHVMSLKSANLSTVNFLPMNELAYLSNWEAEEYRKKL